MAGEWIKFETNTPEKAEVLSITAIMGWDDPDLTVGKLLRVWRWFDQQTVEGNARGVTVALLDRIVGVTGFVSAMQAVGWIEVTESGITLPNFDRHNGKTAKDRALTAKRVAKHKTNAKGNAVIVSPPLPKEEKRREEKIEDRDTGSAKRRTQLAPDFFPNETGLEAAKSKGISVDDELPRFKDFHAGKGSVMLDWQAAWRTWVGNAKQFAPRPGYAPPNPSITVPSKPGMDPALAKAIKDDLNAAAPSPEIRARMKELSGVRP